MPVENANTAKVWKNPHIKWCPWSVVYCKTTLNSDTDMDQFISLLPASAKFCQCHLPKSKYPMPITIHLKQECELPGCDGYQAGCVLPLSRKVEKFTCVSITKVGCTYQTVMGISPSLWLLTPPLSQLTFPMFKFTSCSYSIHVDILK